FFRHPAESHGHISARNAARNFSTFSLRAVCPIRNVGWVPVFGNPTIQIDFGFYVLGFALLNPTYGCGP
ncbi:MAG: hypothetical protein PHN75_03895, partial [Syntrophales bacterium]|nr:hypothetical protein [Syntrophales bacterium]